MKLTIVILLTLASGNLVAAGKTAYINFQELFDNSPQALAANAELEKEFGGRDKDLRSMAKTIRELEKTYQNDSAIMSGEQKKKAEDNIIQKKRRLQFEQQSLKDDLQAKQRELLQTVQVSIKAVIQTYGKDNGYDFIFTDASVAFASETVNITEDILQELRK